MKKGIVLFAVIFVTAALSAMDMSAGGRLAFNTNLGTTAEGDVKKTVDFYKNVISTDVKDFRAGFGGGVYGNFSFINSIINVGLQPELNVFANGGVGLKGSYNVKTSRVSIDYECELTVNTVTLDIPVLLTAGIPLGEVFEIAVGIGPQVSIPLYTKYELIQKINGTERPSATDGAKISAKPNVGMALDFNTKFKLGAEKKIALVLDFRYNLDFTPTKITVTKDGNTLVDEDDSFVRRGLAVGAGCEVKIK